MRELFRETAIARMRQNDAHDRGVILASQMGYFVRTKRPRIDRLWAKAKTRQSASEMQRTIESLAEQFGFPVKRPD